MPLCRTKAGTKTAKAKGRENLVAWLKLLEMHSTKQQVRSPTADYDFS
jgi:hypothetical protein